MTEDESPPQAIRLTPELKLRLQRAAPSGSSTHGNGLNSSGGDIVFEDDNHNSVLLMYGVKGNIQWHDGIHIDATIKKISIRSNGKWVDITSAGSLERRPCLHEISMPAGGAYKRLFERIGVNVRICNSCSELFSV